MVLKLVQTMLTQSNDDEIAKGKEREGGWFVHRCRAVAALDFFLISFSLLFLLLLFMILAGISFVRSFVLSLCFSPKLDVSWSGWRSSLLLIVHLSTASLFSFLLSFVLHTHNENRHEKLEITANRPTTTTFFPRRCRYSILSSFFFFPTSIAQENAHR